MLSTIQCVSSCLLAGGIAANGPLMLGFVSCWMGNESSCVSPRRRPPMDSNREVSGQLTLLGFAVSAVVLYLLGTDDMGFAVFTGLASFFAASRYAFVYSRKLNRFYLSRAQQLLIEGDLIGACQDAREVVRSSPALRSQAKSILRAADQVRDFQPVRDPVEALVLASTLGIEQSQAMSADPFVTA